jgi:serine/threonine protein phosphatase PrpC
MRRRSAALEPGALPPHLQKLQDERRAQIAAAAAVAASAAGPAPTSFLDAASPSAKATARKAPSATSVLISTPPAGAAAAAAGAGAARAPEEAAGAARASEEASAVTRVVPDFEWRVGLHHDQGIRFTMEDAESIVTGIRPAQLGDTDAARPPACPQLAFFGVYDGHGGNAAAEFCRTELPPIVLEAVAARKTRSGDHASGKGEGEGGAGAPSSSSYDDDDDDDDDDDALVSAAMQSAFAKADAMFLQKCTDENLGNVGTTVTTVLCMGDTMYCANAGDSRTVLSRAGKAINLSEDHKPSNTIEEQRVRDAGGFVVMGRVMGKLAVSRAIGDSEFKDPNSRLMSEFSISTPLVVPEPEVVVSHIEAADEFLILACDGLWDIFSSQEAVDMVVASLKSGGSEEDAATNLVNKALQGGSRDNVTALVAVLQRL